MPPTKTPFNSLQFIVLVLILSISVFVLRSHQLFVPALISLSEPIDAPLPLARLPASECRDRRDLSADISALLASVNGTLWAHPSTTKRFLLFRSIDNLLPPHSSEHIAVANLNFTLAHQPDLPDVDVRWYVNHIVHQSYLLKVLQLLVHHKQTFLFDGFDFPAFSRLDYRLHGFHPSDILRSAHFTANTTAAIRARQDALLRIFSPYNHFIRRASNTRNLLIRLGKATGARYILPWESNVFLTSHAFQRIVTDMADVEKKAVITNKYFFVPSSVANSSSDVLNAQSAIMNPRNNSLPLMIFRNDSRERFNTRTAFGCRLTIPLLRRLRVQDWEGEARHPEACPSPPRKGPRDLQRKHRVVPAGYAIRLPQGEDLPYRSESERFDRLIEGVEVLTAEAARESVEQMWGFCRKRTLMVYDRERLSENLETYWSRREEGLNDLVTRLLERANGLRDYGENLNGSSEARIGLRDTIILTLAGYFSGHRGYLQRAARTIERVFDGMKQGGQGAVVADRAEASDICVGLDAVRLLQEAKMLGKEVEGKVDAWVEERSRWMRSEAGGGVAKNGSAGLWMEAQAGCVEGYLGNVGGMLRHSGLARGRMWTQAEETDGGLMENVCGWWWVGEVGERVGVSVWTFGTRPEHGGESLVGRAAMRAVREAKSPQARCAGQAVLWRWGALLSGVRGGPGAWRAGAVPETEADSVWSAGACDGEHDWVPPFWNLATYR